MISEETLEERDGKTVVVNLFAEPYDVYMGNPFDSEDPRNIEPGHQGFLGNPFQTENNKDSELLKFKHYFLERVDQDKKFRLAVLSLYGQRLGCICNSNKACHSHIVANWLNNNSKEYSVIFSKTKV